MPLSRPEEPARGTAHDSIHAAVIASVGHDLRHPLQAVTHAHDALAATLGDTDQRAELARAERATARIGRMLSQLVDAVRLQEQPDRCLHEPVTLRPMLRQLAAEFAEPARQKGIELRVAPTTAVVWSHPALLGSMLRNLVSNALNHTPRGGRVFVGCRSRGPEAHIEIRDSGAGIAHDDLVKVFDAFYRTDTASTEGLGLGLFIVQRAAQLLAHRIKVRSAEGRGSCFTVVAPRPFFDTASCRRHLAAMPRIGLSALQQVQTTRHSNIEL